MYDQIIIGSGAAGINIALQLLSVGNTNFIILEAQPHSKDHGRLLSLNINDKNWLEFGASIFHTNQKGIKFLIDKLNLQPNIIKYGEDTQHYIFNKLSSDDSKSYFKSLQQKLRENAKKYPELSLESLCKKILTKKEIADYKILNFEWFEHNHKNALIYFASEANIGTIFTMRHGVETIVKAGCKLLNRFIKYSSLVTDINYNSTNGSYLITLNNNVIYECRSLYICTNLQNKIKINIPEALNILKMCDSRTCIRVYAIFKQPLSKITSSFIVGDHFGKMSVQVGAKIWLIAYMDGDFADNLNKLEGKDIAKEWLKDINKEFSTDYTVENCLENVIKSYWKDAYTIFKEDYYTKVSSDLTKGKILLNNLKLKHPNLLITTIPKEDGFHIAWTESHLYSI